MLPFVARKAMEDAFEDESEDEGSDDGQYLNLNDEEGELFWFGRTLGNV